MVVSGHVDRMNVRWTSADEHVRAGTQCRDHGGSETVRLCQAGTYSRATFMKGTVDCLDDAFELEEQLGECATTASWNVGTLRCRRVRPACIVHRVPCDLLQMRKISVSSCGLHALDEIGHCMQSLRRSALHLHPPAPTPQRH